MKKITLYMLGILVLISCKKTNVAPDPVSHAGLVKSITHKDHKIDSSGNFHITVDSFLYDNQNRVTNYYNIACDTSFLLDTGGHVIITGTNITHAYSFNYVDNSVIPNIMIASGVTCNIHVDPNNPNQITSITGSQGVLDNHNTYFNGGVACVTSDPGGFYTIDSIAINTNDNVDSLVLGGNYTLNSSNQNIYGRLSLTKFTYSNIENPVYNNKSAATVMFLASGIIQSNNISASTEWVSFVQNSVVSRDELSTLKNTVGSNNLIQSSLSLQYGDLTTWSFY